ncbi:MAG: hypothetical protein ACJ77B_12070, partial [Chloroflexota bacterium]
VGTAVVAALGIAAATGEFAIVVGAAAGMAAAAFAGEWLIRVRGALDGDGIGAIVEVTFAAILLATAAVLAIGPR